MNKKIEYIKFVLSILIIFFWFIFTYTGKVPETSLPKLSSVKNTFFEMIKSGQLYNDLSLSLRRVLGGFFLSSAFGILLGIFMGISANANSNKTNTNDSLDSTYNLMGRYWRSF